MTMPVQSVFTARKSAELLAKFIYIAANVQPYFEEHKIKLVDANLDNIQQYFDYKATHGRKDGNGGLSPKTLRLHKNVLQLAFKEAMRHKLIRSNPCELVRLPKLERREYEWYNASEINTLLETIKDEPLHPLIQTTVMYGLRRSEVLGLQWQSIDFDTNTILIRHTVSMSTKVVEKDKTKNKSSYRSFPLFPEIRELLLQLKEEEQKNREFFGDTYVENDYIFKWANGAMYDPSYISHKFGDLLRKYNLPHIRFHDLRHSCASLLLAKGCSLKDVQDWMGHADIKMTCNIYGHLDLSRKKMTSEIIRETLAQAC